MYRKRFFALIFLFATLIFTASAQQEVPPILSVPPARPAEPSTPAAAHTGSDLVVAKVSGEPITEKQVLVAINILAGQTLLKPEERKTRNILLFKGAIDNIVVLTLLKAEARNQNVTIDKARIDQQIQVFADRYSSKEEFEKAMATQGVDEAALRKSIEETLTMQEVLNRAAKDAPVIAEAEIQKFYDGNPEKFISPDQAHVAQIFLKADPAATAEQKAGMKKTLESIRADIGSQKITFADAAVKFSQDQASSSKGGDMGFIARGQAAKPLDDAIFGTDPGSLTSVIESASGYHLLQVIEKKPAGKATLEEARSRIQQFLTQSAQQNAIQKFVQGLKAKAVVETFMTAEEFDKRHPVE